MLDLFGFTLALREAQGTSSSKIGIYRQASNKFRYQSGIFPWLNFKTSGEVIIIIFNHGNADYTITCR